MQAVKAKTMHQNIGTKRSKTKKTKFINTIKKTLTMTKADIVTKISEETGVDKDTVLTVVEAFMATVKNSLASGNEVFLRGFGSFIIKTRKQKIARNISQNTSIVIPEHNIPSFKPAKTFAELIK